MLETYVFPRLGRRPIGKITGPELLGILKTIETKGLHETARRTKQRCGQIFRHAIGLGYAQRDITLDLRGLLEPPIVTHHASLIEPRSVGGLMRAIDRYNGRPITRCALKLAPLLFVRPVELRTAQWIQFDIAGAEWRIRADIMKMDSPHIVPLSRQALSVLDELARFSGSREFLFPALGNYKRPMSENTINLALRRLGYSADDMTGHGFRSMASTLLNEQGRWSADAIERQLAHGERNSVHAAYNYAEHLSERWRMMQAWADLLDQFRAAPDRAERLAA